MKKYEYDLSVLELILPSETEQYIARVKFMDRIDTDLPQKITHDFGETRGGTRGEAIEKLRVRVEGWMSANK